MARITMRGRGNAQIITKIISDGVLQSGLSCELIDGFSHTLGDAAVSITVFEKYYMRSSNRASLTVAVLSDKDEIIVEAIASGAGQGAIFHFSWGAEEDFVSIVEEVLSNIGFISMS